MDGREGPCLGTAVGRAYLNSRLVGPCLAGLSTRARPPINLNIKTQSLHYMYREPHTQRTPGHFTTEEPHTQGTPVDAASARLLACSCECIASSLIASTGGMAAMGTEQSGMLGSVALASTGSLLAPAPTAAAPRPNATTVLHVKLLRHSSIGRRFQESVDVTDM